MKVFAFPFPVSFLLKVFPGLPIPLSLFTTSVAVAVLFIPDGSIIEWNGIRPVRKKREVYWGKMTVLQDINTPIVLPE